jgi:hypothetical protein
VRVNLGRALGEFLVIVIGVLMALAVDDWREQRESRTNERHLLSVMAGDLVQDSASIAHAARVAPRRGRRVGGAVGAAPVGGGAARAQIGELGG